MQIWSCRERDIETAKEISAILDINLIVSELLVQRGMAGAKEAAAFLRPSLLDLNNPYLFRDMTKVINRLTQALADQEKILVYGDYDVDGVTSTSLLYKVMTDLGFSVVVYIPHRQEEGYGLHREAVDKAIAADVKLILTVDCGISAAAEIQYAASHGIEVIVTDHHEPPQELPPAYAILNPKLKGEAYPFKDLAGVGVAFKLVQAMIAEFGDRKTQLEAEKEVLDLVALGTIADVVPLVGENRIIVAHGLRQMANTVHPGLKALLEECGLNHQIRATQVAFIVAPRINAAGRLDSAKIGIELLLADDLEYARELAKTLSQENQLRQKVEKEILDQALAMLEGKPLPRVIVLAAEDWHHGVIGIVASRLVERFNRPTFLIAIEGESAKGSARGISGYHVLEQITLCQHLLDKFGGHKQAAGFSLSAHHIEQFREQLNLNAQNFAEELFYPEVKIDRLVDYQEISQELMEDLELLAPFGFGNHTPVLGGRFPIHQVSTVGKDGSHLRLHLGPHGQWVGIAFRQGEKARTLKEADSADLAFALEWNVYQGQRNLQIQIKEIDIEPIWKQDPLVLTETAVTAEQPEFTWIDWRNLKRAEWINRLQNVQTTKIDRSQLWIWDTDSDQLTSFTDYLNHQDQRLALQDQMPNQSSVDPNSAIHGVIIGIPLGYSELLKGLRRLAKLGVTHLIWVEGEPMTEELSVRCGYLTRSELVEIFRKLTAHAECENPFIIELSDHNHKEREALRIFEELGLFSCQGGVFSYSVKYHPATQKLDLEASLRYRMGQQLWKQTCELMGRLEGTPIGKLNDIIECNI